MKFYNLFIVILASLLSNVKALPEINVAGQYFRNTANNGTFQIVGAQYSLSNTSINLAAQDVLSDPDACLRDAALLQKAGVNTIHIYTIDPSLSHDLCASIFNSVGIYMMISLSWNTTDPLLARNTTTAYNLDYLQGTFAVIDAVKDYENVLGFTVGDDVSFYQETWSVVPPYIRALVRDTKTYIAKNSARAIPVGVSIYLDLGITDAYDFGYYNAYQLDTWEWAQCSTTPSDRFSDVSRADFFGIANYDWCPGNGTRGATNGTFLQQYNSSGWEDLRSNYSYSSIPVYFSDYGCINDVTPQNRDFLEVAALYDQRYMASYFSGGFVNEWTNVQSLQPGADYGLTILDADGNLQLRQDYDTFSRALGQFDLPGLAAGYEIDSTNGLQTPPTCTRTLISDPSSLSFASIFTIPTAPPGVADLIQSGNNGRRGQLVDVTSTAVLQTIRDSSGNVIRSLAITPSPSSPRTTTGVPTSSLGSGPTSTPGTGPKKSNNAVKIGVGVGVPVGVLLLAGLGVLVFCGLKGRKRRGRGGPVGNQDGISASGDEKGPRGGNGPPGYYHPVAPEEHMEGDEQHFPTELESPEVGMSELDNGYRGEGTRGFTR